MTSRPADGDLTGALLTIARDVLEEPRLTADDDLTAFGGTSLALVRIVAVAHERLDIDIDPRDLPGRFTSRNLAVAARAAPAGG